MKLPQTILINDWFYLFSDYQISIISSLSIWWVLA